MNIDDARKKPEWTEVDVFRVSAQERLTYGPEIAAMRRTQGITQEELAEAAGVTARTVRNIEKQTSAGQPDVLARILRVLGIELDRRDYLPHTRTQIAILAPLIDLLEPSRNQDTFTALIQTVAGAIERQSRARREPEAGSGSTDPAD